MKSIPSNFLIYRLRQPLPNYQDMQDALAQFPANEPTGQRQQTLGFAPVFESPGPAPTYMAVIGHQQYGYAMVRHQERVVPAAEIKKAVTAKTAEFKQTQGRSPCKQELEGFKTDALLALLPRAFVRTTDTPVFFSPDNNLIWVAASSSSRAEDALSKLREAIGTLAVTPPNLHLSPALTMTMWLANHDAGNVFAIQDQCELVLPGEQRTLIKVKGEDLFSEEILNHLKAGKQVRMLSFEWREKLAFSLDADLAIKRLKAGDWFASDLADSLGQESHPQAELEATLLLLCDTLTELTTDLIEALGGEADPSEQCSTP